MGGAQVDAEDPASRSGRALPGPGGWRAGRGGRNRLTGPAPRENLRAMRPLLGRLLLLLPFCSLLLHASQRPNIVFIFSDDHAVGAISAYGSEILQTPQIDRLANEGSVFLNSFCANSICGPSRACILTGKHSHINGFRRNGERFDGSQTTFPKLLQASGYQTALVGKWHLSSDPTGFHHWEILPGQGSYYNPVFLQMDGTRKEYTGYCTDIVTDQAIEWLEEQRDPGRPFMLMCQHKAPHRNWSPALRHLSYFDGRDVPEPPTLFDDYQGRTALLQENEMTIDRHFHWGHDAKFTGENQAPEHFAGRHSNGEYRRMNDEQRTAWDAQYEPENQAFLADLKAGKLSDADVLRWKYQRYVKDYLRTVVAVDESVGRILDYLDANGLRENTMVIYSSDQGFYLGEHGWYDKRWMFEESLKMPFLIRWPGVVEAGTRSTALIQNIDYAPTFLEAAGAPVPEEMQGRSLLPLLANRSEAPSDWRDAVYYAYYENASAHAVPIHDGVRTQDHKLMYFPRGNQWQLFDLAADPLEMRSVHDQPDYQDVLAGLRKRYRDLRSFYRVNNATIPMTRADEDWWRQRERDIQQRLREEGPHDLAFIGDSITQGWEGRGRDVWHKRYQGMKAVNLGFSGRSHRTCPVAPLPGPRGRLQAQGGCGDDRHQQHRTPDAGARPGGRRRRGHRPADPPAIPLHPYPPSRGLSPRPEPHGRRAAQQRGHQPAPQAPPRRGARPLHGHRPGLP